MFNFLISLIIASQLFAPIIGIIEGMKSKEDLGWPKRKITESFEPLVDATSALAVDVGTSKILYQKNAFSAMPIASLSKLMTAVVFLEQNPDLTKTVSISQDDKESGGKVIFKQGDVIYLKDIFYVALIASINSAAYELALASGVTYDDFIALMNIKAQEIGMENTTFFEPTGLSPKNVSNAWDIFLLLKYAMTKEEIRDALASSDYSFRSLNGNDYKVKNTNDLLGSYLHSVGGKTGYIDEAGYCLVDWVTTSACDQGVITVILGAASKDARFQINKFVTQWVFDNWEWEDLK